MERIPEKWINRIFERLAEVYKEKWIDRYGDLSTSCKYHMLWSSALTGLTAEEIKYGIETCRHYPTSSVPTALEFFHIAKGLTYPYKLKTVKRTQQSQEIAKKNLDSILFSLSSKRRVNSNVV